MKLGMYSLYDKVVEIFEMPVLCHNDGHAMRMFCSVFTKAGSRLRDAEPIDYRLFRIGDFQDQDGSIVTPVSPVLVCEMTELVSRVLNENRVKIADWRSNEQVDKAVDENASSDT